MVGLVALFGLSRLSRKDLKQCPKLYKWMTENHDKVTKSVSRIVCSNNMY